MPELRPLGAAFCALATFVLVSAVFGRVRPSPAEIWLRHREVAVGRPAFSLRLPRLGPAGERVRDAVGLRLERAGWTSSADSVLGWTAAATMTALATGTVLRSAVLGLLLASAPGAFVALNLRSSARRRRRVALAELASVLELVGLELASGGSPQAALAGVLSQTSGPLSRDLTQLLIAAQLGAGPPLDVRLERMAERQELAPLRSLAAILAMSRQYGSGVGDGVRALAADLRRAQRRELIARSRLALNRVLVPAAVGVLLPFMAILLYPAVAALLRSYS